MEIPASDADEIMGGAEAHVPHVQTHEEIAQHKQELIGLLSSPPVHQSLESQLPGDSRSVTVPRLHSDGPMVGASVVAVLLLLAGFAVLAWFALFRNPF